MDNQISIVSLNQTLEIGDLQLSDDFAQINKSLAIHPGKYQEIMGLLVELECKIKEKQGELSILTAELDEKIREENQSKKMTETFIKKQILLDPKIQSLQKEVEVLRRDELKLNAIKEAYQHKKDCLITLASNLRAQYLNSGQINI